MQNGPAEPKRELIVKLDEKIEGRYRNSVTHCLPPAAWYSASQRKSPGFCTTRVASSPPGVRVRAW